MPETEIDHITTPAGHRSPSPDEKLINAAKRYNSAMDKLSEILANVSVSTKNLDRGQLRSIDPTVATVGAGFEATRAAMMQAVADVVAATSATTSVGRWARADMLLRILDEAADEGYPLEKDGVEMALMRAIVDDAAAQVRADATIN